MPVLFVPARDYDSFALSGLCHFPLATLDWHPGLYFLRRFTAMGEDFNSLFQEDLSCDTDSESRNLRGQLYCASLFSILLATFTPLKPLTYLAIPR